MIFCQMAYSEKYKELKTAQLRSASVRFSFALLALLCGFRPREPFLFPKPMSFSVKKISLWRLHPMDELLSLLNYFLENSFLHWQQRKSFDLTIMSISRKISNDKKKFPLLF